MQQWASASEFFAMGGYALYVWGAYGVTAIALALEPVLAARRHQRALVAAAQRDAAQAREH
jgi:heme exporter protein D